MSATMFLELEEGLTEDELRMAACRCGAVAPSDEHPFGTLAVFPSSDLDVYVHSDSGNSRVVAEGLPQPADWPVGLRVSLGIAQPTYDLCLQDIRRLIEQLTMSTTKRFVVSREYEKLCALRDQQGLHYFPGDLHP